MHSRPHRQTHIRSTLHQPLPSILPSPACFNYPDQQETLEYILYLCLPKLFIWQRIWNGYFQTHLFSFTLAHALFRLKLPVFLHPVLMLHWLRSLVIPCFMFVSLIGRLSLLAFLSAHLLFSLVLKGW